LLFVLTLVVVLQVVTPSQSRGQRMQPVKFGETDGSASNSGKSSSSLFLKLAETVGQGVPARRLVDYIGRNDPSSKPRYWAVVDFNRPSTEKRLFLFDTQANKVTTYYVAHGKGSEGEIDDGMADTFSNEHGSNSSSLGIYRALEEYVGSHGRSMRLQGLEPTNSNAFDRAVVFHRADYVSEDFIRQTGRLGRSDGCLAVESAVADELIDKLENGGYIIVWKK
jgi:hypothetical protein